MSAVVRSTGVVVKAGAPPVRREPITSEDVQNTQKLAEILNRIQRDVEDHGQRLAAEYIDYEDVTTGLFDSKVTLEHKFNSRVRWSVVGWQTSGTTLWNLREDTTNTTVNTLVLLSRVSGTATIRVWRAD